MHFKQFPVELPCFLPFSPPATLLSVSAGFMVYSSTAASTRTGKLGLYDVWSLYGASIEAVLPHTTKIDSVYLGDFCGLEPTALQYCTFEEYARANPGPWRRVYCVHNMYITLLLVRL